MRKPTDVKDAPVAVAFQGKVTCPACTQIYGKAHADCARCGGTGLIVVEDLFDAPQPAALDTILRQMRQRLRPN